MQASFKIDVSQASLVYWFRGRKTFKVARLHIESIVRRSQFYPAALLSVLFISLYNGDCQATSSAPLKESAVTLSESRTDNNEEQLPTIARATLRKHFGLEHKEMTLSEFARSFVVAPRYRRRAGLFVTLSKEGKTRACWGALEPRFNNLVEATVFTTEQAWTDEYRFKKITADEIEALKPQITVVTKVLPLHSVREQNPRRCGMLVRSGGKSGIILAGETTDPFYQLVQCKLKAGILKNEPCQMYRIEGNEYR